MTTTVKKRFRQFLPVVVDVETAGVNPETNALLEICAIVLDINEAGQWVTKETFHEHVKPFEGANLDKKSLDFIGMDPFHPFRMAIDENQALDGLFKCLKQHLKQTKCTKTVLVGHNAWFDLLFLKAATARCKLKSPFHSFTSFDTATLAGLYYGETVLAKACKAARIKFNVDEAHSAIYDAQKTAELFCKMVNHFDA